VVSVGQTEGRAFTAQHGDGLLSPSGQANAANWPDSSGLGAGFRGGGFESSKAEIMVSNRSWAARTDSIRASTYGGRGVRSRVCSVPVAQADSIVVNVPPFENILELTTGGSGPGEGYLWVTPTDWRVINGQGTNTIFINIGAYPVTIRVFIINECGAGQERTLVLTN
jgi:hypothetical protein